MNPNETGVAFSGGGIRSAALCSGVLRRLLQVRAKVDYLSCVSGGGYTGTAFLDWKYRNEKKAKDNQEWHEEFFDNMRRRVGFICNWEKPCQGILDSIMVFFLMLTVTVIEPIVIYGSYAFPLAFINDYLFGKLLRAKVDCDHVTAVPSANNPDATAQGIREHCLSRQGTVPVAKTILFLVLLAFYVTFYILSRKLSDVKSKYFRLFSTIFFLFLCFTFLPFAINDFFIEIPVWSRAVIVVIGVVLWFVLPMLRDKTSYGIIIYLYSYIIYWRVYEAKVVDVVYSDGLFNKLLFASGCVLWSVPYLRQSRERLVHVFNRWKLRKAFYSEESSRTRGCLEILQDIFCPLWTCLLKNRRQRSKQHTDQQMDILSDDEERCNNEPPETRPLNLSDLRGTEPELISNTTVHNWEKNIRSDRDYDILTMSPTAIERLDRDPSDVNRFEGKLDPRDVELDDAMATSAAAISGYDDALQVMRLSTILGFEMGASMVSDMKAVKEESCIMKPLPLLINFLRGLPLIAVPAVYFTSGGERSIEVGVIVFFVIHLILAFIGAFADTGAGIPKLWEKIARWFIVHVSFVEFVRETLSVENIGSMPPPVMLLSDGGHMENTGILPLLKKKLKKIVVVNGGYTSDEKRYGDDLLKALMLARTELNCSFIGQGGRDVISDLLDTFVKPNKPDVRKPRYYRFKVEYYKDDGGKDGEGEIMMIRPRSPRKGDESEVKTWEEFGFNLEPNDWGNSPYLTGEEVDKLTFCCCECCNKKSCLSGLSELLCDRFPNTSTANQFFTPLQFSAYHREGYRACVEAQAAEFLMEDHDVQEV